MAKNQKEWLVSWLNDAHAMEEALVPILENQASDAQEHPQIQSRLQAHADQTRRHANMVEECLEKLGESPSSVKTGMGKVFGAMQSASTSMAADDVIKNGLAGYAAENFEVASYKALIEAARTYGDEQITQTCQQILNEDMAMAEWLDQQLPQMVKVSMRDGAGS